MPGLNWNAMVAIHFCRGELSTFSPLALSFSEVKRTWAVSPKNAMEVIFTTTLPLSFNTDRGEPGACTLREYSLATSPSDMSLHASNCSEMVNQSYLHRCGRIGPTNTCLPPRRIGLWCRAPSAKQLLRPCSCQPAKSWVQVPCASAVRPGTQE